MAPLSRRSRGWKAPTRSCAIKGTREYSIEEPVFGDPTRTAFRKLPKAIEFTQSYLEQQALLTQFIADAFDGRAPTIEWSLAPIEPKE